MLRTYLANQWRRDLGVVEYANHCLCPVRNVTDLAVENGFASHLSEGGDVTHDHRGPGGERFDHRQTEAFAFAWNQKRSR